VNPTLRRYAIAKLSSQEGTDWDPALMAGAGALGAVLGSNTGGAVANRFNAEERALLRNAQDGWSRATADVAAARTAGEPGRIPKALAQAQDALQSLSAVKAKHPVKLTYMPMGARALGAGLGAAALAGGTSALLSRRQDDE